MLIEWEEKRGGKGWWKTVNGEGKLWYARRVVKAFALSYALLDVKKGKHMFKEKEKVVYPGHGVAIIDRILERKIGGKVTNFFELKFINKDMTILVPIDNSESIGIRRVSSEKDIGTLFKIFSEPVEHHHHEVALNWNKRNKVYQGKIRSGNIKEIGQIYRDLRYIERQKELSFGEKNLLQQTEALLAEEIAFACDIGADVAANQLRVLVHYEL